MPSTTLPSARPQMPVHGHGVGANLSRPRLRPQAIWAADGMEMPKTFLRLLLQPDPLLRPNAREALLLPWLVDAEGASGVALEACDKAQLSETVVGQ